MRKREADASQRGQSIQWFRRRAEQGDGRAQYFLGDIYASGKLIAKDEVQAHVWFHLAAMNGHGEAKVKREVVAKGLTTDQIAEATCLARTWAKKIQEEEDHV